MEALLTEWGTEILFGLISAAVIGYAKWKNSKLMQAKEQAEKNAEILAEQKIDNKITSKIDIELEPVYQELEDLRKYCRENENLEKSHMALIVASYRFRLIQLCKGFLNQGFITTAQMEQLSEFYKLYTGLGGNGQAKVYYDKAMQLPLKVDDDETDV
jgi:hypothetical protein